MRTPVFSITATRCVQMAAMLVPALLLSGCIGAQNHSDVEAEARQRGGGAEPFVIREAVEAVAAEVSADPDELLVASIRIYPQYVTLEAADPRTPGNWDRYQYRNGRVADTDPVNVAHMAPAGFMLGDFRALDRLPELVADAGRRAGFAEGRLTSLEISAEVDHMTGETSGPKISTHHSDPRRGIARHEYDADGHLL